MMKRTDMCAGDMGLPMNDGMAGYMPRRDVRQHHIMLFVVESSVMAQVARPSVKFYCMLKNVKRLQENV